MTQLYLAYSHENAPLADQIAAQLTDIECLRHTDKNHDTGFFANVLQETEIPVVLLVTDNFIKNEVCMSGVLGMLLSLMRQSRILPVVANGVTITDGREVPVETHIDRVINAIQYMNFWQQKYLTLSDQYNHAEEEGRAALQERLQLIHSIADQTGEFISALRDADYMKWNDLAEAAFTDIYRKLNIPHATQHKETEPPAPAMPPPVASHTPEPEPAKITFPVAGPVLFKSAPPVLPAQPEEEAPPVPPGFMPENHLIYATSANEETLGDTGQYREQEIQQTISDAWGWIERGNRELGLSVLRLAAEQYPDNIQIKQAYEKAQETGIEVTEITDFEQEAHSYEAAGDSAFIDGDYLMAKYCWDRAGESNPNLSGIWRKLGLLTSDQLTGYNETSIAYLRKALLENPEDAPVIERLTRLGEHVPAAIPAPVDLAPLSTAEVVEPIIAPLVVDTNISMPVQEPTVEEQHKEPVAVAEETPVPYHPVPVPATPAYPTRRQETVLITGATSGIGKATAMEFARHGYRLIITGRRAEKLYEVKDQITAAFHTEVLPLVFDVRDSQAVDYTLTNLPGDWKDIDILINNAGLAKGLSPIHEGNLEHWETMIDTNIKGLLYVSRIISQGMVKRRKGHIVNLSSSAGKETYANGNVYCATKFAVEALTRSMRVDLYQHNIRVSQVSPGHVEETEFAINRFDGDAQRARIYDDFQPLKASDVAEAIWFIASRPAHVNIQDVYMFGTQQASATVVDRSGRS